MSHLASFRPATMKTAAVVSLAGLALAAPVLAAPGPALGTTAVKTATTGQVSRYVYQVTNVRAGASISTALVGKLSVGTTVTGTLSNGWIKIATPAAQAGRYVSDSVLRPTSTTTTPTPTTPTPTTPTPPTTAGQVTRSVYQVTNVRSGASTSTSLVGTLSAGTTVTGILSNGWVKIATPAAYAGRYVSDSVLRPAPTTGTTTPPTTTTPMGTLQTPYGCWTRPTLAVGSTGECVKAVSFTINSWNMRTVTDLPMLPLTGTFTAQTLTNLNRLQSASGIPVTRSVDATTWRTIEALSKNTAAGTSIVKTQPHAAFPGAGKLQDGRLMAVFRQASQHVMSTSNRGTIWKVYSPDNGYTWTKPEKIPLTLVGSSTLTTNGVTDPGLSVPRTGRLAGRPLLTYFESMPNGTSEARVVVASDTSGNTWGRSQHLDFSPSGSDYVSSAALQLDDDNFLSAGYGAQLGGIGAQSLKLTWDGLQFTSAPSVSMAKTTNGMWFTEPNVIKLRDGRLLSLIRTDKTTTQTYIYKAYSLDGGASWQPYTVAFAGYGNPHMALLDNGTIVVSYRHLTGGDLNNPTKSGNMQNVYRSSRDGGATWSGETQIGTRPAYEMAYSMPVEYAPNKVVFVWASESSGYNSDLKVNYADFS